MLQIEMRIGGNGRIINKIIGGTFYRRDTRDIIRDGAIKCINSNWLIGCGLATDRLVLSQQLGVHDTTYCHNIILEVLLQYGIIFGIIILLFLARHLIKTIKITKTDTCAKKCLIVMIALGILPLLMSSSYLQWTPFFILLGLCSSINKTAGDQAI